MINTLVDSISQRRAIVPDGIPDEIGVDVESSMSYVVVQLTAVSPDEVYVFLRCLHKFVALLHRSLYISCPTKVRFFFIVCNVFRQNLLAEKHILRNFAAQCA